MTVPSAPPGRRPSAVRHRAAHRTAAVAPPGTPDAHDFPTRPYDLVKEFASRCSCVAVLTAAWPRLLLARREADHPADWATAAPDDVVATAAGELAGTTTSAAYGPPYNTPPTGRRSARCRCSVGAASGSRSTRPTTSSSRRCARRRRAPPWPRPGRLERGRADQQRTAWATAYADALAQAPDGDPAAVAAGDYGPVPALAAAAPDARPQRVAWRASLTSRATFYGGDATRALLLLADGTYLEDQARADISAATSGG